MIHPTLLLEAQAQDPGVSTETIAIVVFVGLVSAAMSALFASRLNGLERQISGLRGDLKTESDAEIASVREDMSGLRHELQAEMRAEVASPRAEIAVLRDELRADLRSLNAEVGSLRSDLTQLALALGPRGPSPES